MGKQTDATTPSLTTLEVKDPGQDRHPGQAETEKIFRSQPPSAPATPLELRLPASLEAAIVKIAKSADNKFDEKAFEERLLILVDHRLFKRLTDAGFYPKELLDAYERRYASVLRRDSNIANAAFGALGQPAAQIVPPQQPPTQPAFEDSNVRA